MVQNSSLPPLKEGYITLKRTLYHRFFTHTSYLFAFLTLFELLRALYFFKISILFETSLLFIAGTIFYKWISTLKHHQEISMTIFWTLLYFLSILAHYYGDTGYFNHPQDSFHFGTINSIFESLIISRMPKLSHRIAFSSCNALTRLILIPPKDKSLLAVQFSSLLFGFFLDFDKETHDQNLFTTYFNHKQQLIQFKHLVSQDIPEGILIISQDLKQCLFMNNHFKALTGNSSLANVKAQLASFTLQEVLPNLPQNDLETSITEPSIHQETLWSFLEQHCKQPQHKKTSCHISYQGQETQQEYRFEAKIVHIIWDEQPSLAIIFHDITQHHTILGLQIADSHKDKILATVSHELRTPLNSIMGMIQIMLKEVKDQSLVQYLDICKSSGLLLSGLVNSIVDLNLIRARKFKVNPEKIELRKFIRETLHLFEFQCSQKGIYLKSKLSSLLPIYIVTDKDRLSQIFINLLSNSLKFTNTGGITISAQVASNKDYIEFTVADTGFGIKSHDKEKLFTKEFSRINPQGVGLGLAVSDSLARLLGHQGEGLVVASEENKGSKLSFIIKKSLGGISRGSIEGIIPASPEYFPSPPIPSIKEVGDVNNRMQNYCSKLKRANTLQLLTFFVRPFHKWDQYKN